MKTVEMGSCSMTYIPSYMKTGSAVRMLIRGHADTQSHKMNRDHKLYLIFQSQESRLKCIHLIEY